MRGVFAVLCVARAGQRGTAARWTCRLGGKLWRLVPTRDRGEADPPRLVSGRLHPLGRPVAAAVPASRTVTCCDTAKTPGTGQDGAGRRPPAGCTCSGACAAVLPSAAVLLLCALTCTITAGTASTATREVGVSFRHAERRPGGRSGSTAARRPGTCCACSPCAESGRPCARCRAGCRSRAASR